MIPDELITSLGREAINVFWRVDQLIDVYKHQGRSVSTIILRAKDYDLLNKKLSPKYDLQHDRYKNYKLIRGAR